MMLRHPTPTEVLAIMVDQHRHQSQVDPEAEPDAVLTMHSTIADWRNACDLVGWRGLGRALNDEWGMALNTRRWREILEPPDKRTLRTLCETISQEALIESFPAIGFLGCRSSSGRAMRAIRAVLVGLGVPRHEIRSTTAVASLMTRYGWRFLVPCLRIAPGALPALKHVGKFHRMLLIAIGALLLAGIPLELFNSPLGAWSLILALTIMILLWIPHPLFRGSLILPGVANLADLATHLGRWKDREPSSAPGGSSCAELGNSDTNERPPEAK